MSLAARDDEDDASSAKRFCRSTSSRSSADNAAAVPYAPCTPCLAADWRSERRASLTVRPGRVCTCRYTIFICVSNSGGERFFSSFEEAASLLCREERAVARGNESERAAMISKSEMIVAAAPCTSFSSRRRWTSRGSREISARTASKLWAAAESVRSWGELVSPSPPDAAAVMAADASFFPAPPAAASSTASADRATLSTSPGNAKTRSFSSSARSLMCITSSELPTNSRYRLANTRRSSVRLASASARAVRCRMRISSMVILGI
mmetsp:Transcript_16603/g.35055  ORF Transcript_16603/g.35055 Transcript_16603/m.35055 type:complete len:266 (+) Transcript_16603:130-927(+)